MESPTIGEDSPEDILTLPPPPADRRIPYGPLDLQFGDLRLPRSRGPHPVAVVLHGGFWRTQYDLGHTGHLCAALTGAGIAAWNVEYRRIGNKGGGWPGTFLDVARAVDALRGLAGEYDLDLRRAVSVGHSAGGHLALWLAGRHRIPPTGALAARDPLPLLGAVSLAGVCDLRHGWDLRLRGGIVRTLMDGAPDEVPDRYREGSPADLLPLGVRQTLIHGTEDGSVPYEVSERYAARAAALGDQCDLIPLPGAGHFEPIDPRSDEWPVVQDAVLSMLGHTP